MRVCDVPDCGRKHKGHGLCPAHLRRLNEGLPMGPPIGSLPGYGRWVNPLVCVCPEPLSPSGIGECQRCYRCLPSLLHPKAVQS